MLRLDPRATVILLALALPAAAVAVGGQDPEAAPPDAAEALETPVLTAEEEAFFEANVRPVLATRCYSCHSAQLDEPEGSLLLDSREGVLRGGTRGPAIVPGEPRESLLIHAVRRTHKDLQMPPPDEHDRLSDQEVDALVAWIEIGAPDPRTAEAPLPALASSYDWEAEAEHWAYQPVGDPAPPDGVRSEWGGTAIDRFVKTSLDEAGLTPVGRADRRALIRRATYDLTGLPPTPEAIRAFLEDDSPDAFERVVERLLASPQYGEQWGRHWMDVVRYADTAGDNSDFPIPSNYRYRNYIIDSFNADKPYDQFLREQLAGDLLPADNHERWQEQVIATGYLANARRFASNPREFHLTLDDTLENLGQGILGLTLGCARCHDHKYDPIPDDDYYALYGIFRSSKYAFPGIELLPRAKDFVAIGCPEEQAELAAYEEEFESIFTERQRIQRALRGRRDDPPATGREAERLAFELYEVEQRLEEITEAYEAIEKAYAVTEGDEPSDARVLVLGDPAMPGREVPRGFLTILGGQRLPEDAEGSGRLQLAGWVTDPANPLVARVMVNRIWAWHFGRGIVDTPNDFGARGSRPTHPALLDYLTSRFVEGGWSVKAMHRLIMHTRTYQAATTYDQANAREDADNRWLWRFTPRRLSAEEIRDTLLAISGNLDYSQAGPHPFPSDLEYGYTQHRPFTGVHEEPERYGTNRRSVYLLQQRLRTHPFLDLWDGADPNMAVGAREESVTPIHALYMMNDAFIHEQADDITVRAYIALDDDAERLGYLYELLFGRPPTRAEVRDARQYLDESRAAMPRLVWSAFPDDGAGDGSLAVEETRVNREAWASLVRVLLSSNEFVTLGDNPAASRGWWPWPLTRLGDPAFSSFVLLLTLIGAVSGVWLATRRGRLSRRSSGGRR